MAGFTAKDACIVNFAAPSGHAKHGCLLSLLDSLQSGPDQICSPKPALATCPRRPPGFVAAVRLLYFLAGTASTPPDTLNGSRVAYADESENLKNKTLCLYSKRYAHSSGSHFSRVATLDDKDRNKDAVCAVYEPVRLLTSTEQSPMLQSFASLLQR